MSFIQVNNLSKHFKIFKREAGLKGALQSFFNRKYENVYAVKNCSVSIDKGEIINMHLNTDFFIYMVGFIPGHPFMGDLNSKLFLNRLTTPRVKVPAGSVGIVEKFCNIYPHESPGGWNIIGRTPIKLFDPQQESNPCLLSPGDTIKFKLISKEEFKKTKR